MVVDAGGASVRERERREWDTAAGLVGLSLRKPPKCKRLTAKTRGQSLSVSRYRAQTVVSQPLNAGSRSLTPHPVIYVDEVVGVELVVIFDNSPLLDSG